MLLIVFVFGLVVIAVFTYNGFNTLVPLMINFAYFVSSYFKNPKYIRVVLFICGFMWIYYNISVGAYIIIIGNCFEIVSATISLLRFRENNK